MPHVGIETTTGIGLGGYDYALGDVTTHLWIPASHRWLTLEGELVLLFALFAGWFLWMVHTLLFFP